MPEGEWCARQDLNLHALRHYHLKESGWPVFIGFFIRGFVWLRFGCVFWLENGGEVVHKDCGCPTPPAHPARMTNVPRKRVVLETDLEIMAGGLSWRERAALAEKLERWARQLRVSSRILRPAPRPARQRLPFASPQRQRLN